MYTSEFDRLKAQKDAIEEKQEAARFESELRRRVEALSGTQIVYIASRQAWRLSFNEALIAALLAPSATSSDVV
jgi:hypothetical protein